MLHYEMTLTEARKIPEPEQEPEESAEQPLKICVRDRYALDPAASRRREIQKERERKRQNRTEWEVISHDHL